MTVPDPIICTAIVREMPTKPDDTREWFRVFLATAEHLRDDIKREYCGLGDMSKTIAAFNRVIAHYRQGLSAAG